MQKKQKAPPQWFDGSVCSNLQAGPPCRGQRRLGDDAPKIVFLVADVPRARDELLRRGVPMGRVRSPAPGVQVCDGLDPEGNSFPVESHA